MSNEDEIQELRSQLSKEQNKCAEYKKLFTSAETTVKQLQRQNEDLQGRIDKFILEERKREAEKTEGAEANKQVQQNVSRLQSQIEEYKTLLDEKDEMIQELTVALESEHEKLKSFRRVATTSCIGSVTTIGSAVAASAGLITPSQGMGVASVVGAGALALHAFTNCTNCKENGKCGQNNP